MKAISLWQPYASFMASYLKWNETRSWSTSYRGELAICAAKRNWMPGEFGDDVEWLANRMGDLWLHENKLKRPEDRPLLFPKGYVVCVVNLHDCQPVDDLKVSPLEKVLGNYAVGRFAWLTRHCRPLKNPVPVTGRQGLFNLPAEVEKKVREQL